MEGHSVWSLGVWWVDVVNRIRIGGGERWLRSGMDLE